MPLIIAGTDSITLPVGTTAQRNATPVTGMNRFNSTTGVTEFYNGTNWVSSPIISGTAISTTGNINNAPFTGIPAGVKRITIMFAGVSTNGTSNLQVQLGTGSTTYTTTGYSTQQWGANTSLGGITTGFGLTVAVAAAGAYYGSVVLTNLTGNTWTQTAILGTAVGGNQMNISAGYITLGAVLTAVQLTTVNGTDGFDAGSINILYE